MRTVSGFDKTTPTPIEYIKKFICSTFGKKTLSYILSHPQFYASIPIIKLLKIMEVKKFSFILIFEYEGKQFENP